MQAFAQNPAPVKPADVAKPVAAPVTDPLVISATGNVGIGTATPRVKLEVVGAVRATGRMDVIGDLAVKSVTSGGAISATAGITAGGDLKSTGGRVYDLLGEVMPKGAIIMWSGDISTIPQGWTFCNGQNGAPDLQDRFIMGAGNVASRTTGGNKTIDITHSHKLEKAKLVSFCRDNNHGWTLNMGGDDPNTTSSGGNMDITPSFFALAFIMKQ